MVICLERDADLHMAQLMPLPLTVSCFLVLAHPGSPDKGPLNVGMYDLQRLDSKVHTSQLSQTHPHDVQLKSYKNRVNNTRPIVQASSHYNRKEHSCFLHKPNSPQPSCHLMSINALTLVGCQEKHLAYKN